MFIIKILNQIVSLVRSCGFLNSVPEEPSTPVWETTTAYSTQYASGCVDPVELLLKIRPYGMYSPNYFAENSPVYLMFNGSSHSAARVGTKWNKRIKRPVGMAKN